MPETVVNFENKNIPEHYGVFDLPPDEIMPLLYATAFWMVVYAIISIYGFVIHPTKDPVMIAANILLAVGAILGLGGTSGVITMIIHRLWKIAK